MPTAPLRFCHLLPTYLVSYLSQPHQRSSRVTNKHWNNHSGTCRPPAPDYPLFPMKSSVVYIEPIEPSQNTAQRQHNASRPLTHNCYNSSLFLHRSVCNFGRPDGLAITTGKYSTFSQRHDRSFTAERRSKPSHLQHFKRNVSVKIAGACLGAFWNMYMLETCQFKSIQTCFVVYPNK